MIKPLLYTNNVQCNKMTFVPYAGTKSKAQSTCAFGKAPINLCIWAVWSGSLLTFTTLLANSADDQ